MHYEYKRKCDRFWQNFLSFSEKISIYLVKVYTNDKTNAPPTLGLMFQAAKEVPSIKQS